MVDSAWVWYGSPNYRPALYWVGGLNLPEGLAFGKGVTVELSRTQSRSPLLGILVPLLGQLPCEASAEILGGLE